MATTFKNAALGSATTLFSTDANSLASATFLAGSVTLDNSTNLYQFCGIELHLATQSARAAGATVTVFMAPDLVGSSTQDQTAESIVACVFALDAATTARTHTQIGLWLPPSAAIKWGILNSTGQAFAASGNTLKIIPWYTQGV